MKIKANKDVLSILYKFDSLLYKFCKISLQNNFKIIESFNTEWNIGFEYNGQQNISLWILINEKSILLSLDEHIEWFEISNKQLDIKNFKTIKILCLIFSSQIVVYNYSNKYKEYFFYDKKGNFIDKYIRVTTIIPKFFLGKYTEEYYEPICTSIFC